MCLFCKIATKEIPAYILYEDELVMAFLDIKPVNLGHALVIPKKHFANLYEFDRETNDAVFNVVQKLAVSIKYAMNADGINLGMNNDTAAGQLIFHAHVHVMPRFTGDGFEHWHGSEVTPDALVDAAKKIKEALN